MYFLLRLKIKYCINKFNLRFPELLYLNQVISKSILPDESNKLAENISKTIQSSLNGTESSLNFSRPNDFYIKSISNKYNQLSQNEITSL